MFSFPLHSNVGFFTGAGENIIIESKSRDIYLDTEEIEFSISHANQSGINEQNIPLVNVRCTFVIKNSSRKKITSILGFPFAHSSQVNEAPVSKLEILENGKPVTGIRSQVNEKKYFDRNKGVYNGTVYYWNSDFAAREEKKLTITYTQGFSITLYNEYFRNEQKENSSYYRIFEGVIYYFPYITSTVKTWSKNVRKAGFKIVLNDFPVTEMYPGESRKDYYKRQGTDRGYGFAYTLPDTFRFSRDKKEYDLYIEDFNGDDDIFFNYIILSIPGDKNEVKPYLKKYNYNKEVYLYVRNFYEAVNGRRFGNKLDSFFKGFTWYKPVDDYSIEKIPERDAEIIKEFDSLMKSQGI